MHINGAHRCQGTLNAHNPCTSIITSTSDLWPWCIHIYDESTFLTICRFFKSFFLLLEVDLFCETVSYSSSCLQTCYTAEGDWTPDPPASTSTVLPLQLPPYHTQLVCARLQTPGFMHGVQHSTNLTRLLSPDFNSCNEMSWACLSNAISADKRWGWKQQ